MLTYQYRIEERVETKYDSFAIFACEIFNMYAEQARGDKDGHMEHLFSFSILYEGVENDLDADHRYLYDLERLSVAANLVVSRDQIPSPLGHIRTSRRVSNALVSVSELSEPSPSGVRYCNGIIVLPAGIQDDLTSLIETEAVKVGLTGVLVRSDFHSPEEAFLWLMQGPTVKAEKLEGFIHEADLTSAFR